MRLFSVLPLGSRRCVYWSNTSFVTLLQSLTLLRIQARREVRCHGGDPFHAVPLARVSTKQNVTGGRHGLHTGVAPAARVYWAVGHELHTGHQENTEPVPPTPSKSATTRARTHVFHVSPHGALAESDPRKPATQAASRSAVRSLPITLGDSRVFQTQEGESCPTEGTCRRDLSERPPLWPPETHSC